MEAEGGLTTEEEKAGVKIILTIISHRTHTFNNDETVTAEKGGEP